MIYKTEKDAIAAANSLKYKMRTPDNWTISVWQNSEWHFAIENGSMYISPTWDTNGIQYFGLLSDDPKHRGGYMGWSNSFFHKDPNMVAEHIIKVAKAHIEKLLDSVNTVKL